MDLNNHLGNRQIAVFLNESSVEDAALAMPMFESDFDQMIKELPEKGNKS